MKDLFVTGLVCLLFGFTVGDKYREITDEYIDSQNQVETSNLRPVPAHNTKWVVPPVVPITEKEVPIADMHLTVFVGEDTRYAVWFDSNPELIKLKEKSNFNVISIYDHRFPRYKIDTVPAVLLQNRSGRVIYWAAGTKLPNSPKALHTAMQKQIALCPWLTPEPEPKPEPKPEPTPVVKPADVVIEEPQPDLPNPILLAVLALAGGGLGYYTGKDEA